MSKVLREVKSITNSKWNKCIEELNVVRDATWPKIDIDVDIYELIEDIKDLPS